LVDRPLCATGNEIGYANSDDDDVYTPCPEKRGHGFFSIAFLRMYGHRFVIFGVNHPEDSFY